jgi:uncharacterized protein YdeI (YjbR/CyaY-like superfamily)
MTAPDLPVRAFTRPRQWRSWLDRNHSRASGVWLRFFKKASGVASITYSQALDEALCHGWIDGQVRKHDEKSWLQRYTPRRRNSLWSKRNTLHVARLTKAGKMAPGGLAEVRAAKADGRWKRAYDSHGTMRMPADFLRALSKNKRAEAFFDGLNKTNRYAIAWRLQTARTAETRARRMKVILAMMAKGEKFH